MQIKITSERQNPLLKRKEIIFQVEHEQEGTTPPRSEIRKAIAAALKSDEALVSIRRFSTKTGTHTATGTANIYDSISHANLIEPKYVTKRNNPQKEPEKTEKE